MLRFQVRFPQNIKIITYIRKLELRQDRRQNGASQVALVSGKEPSCQRRRHKRRKSHPWVRKIPWGGDYNPLQYSCLKKPMDRRAWRATVPSVVKSQEGLKHSCRRWISKLANSKIVIDWQWGSGLYVLGLVLHTYGQMTNQSEYFDSFLNVMHIRTPRQR